jgi:hypothetical protein
MLNAAQGTLGRLDLFHFGLRVVQSPIKFHLCNLEQHKRKGQRSHQKAFPFLALYADKFFTWGSPGAMTAPRAGSFDAFPPLLSPRSALVCNPPPGG